MMLTANTMLSHQNSSSRIPGALNNSGDFPRIPVNNKHSYHMVSSNYSMNLFLSSEGFSKENVRLASFRKWPMHSRANPSSLAEAGFYYTGEGAGDTVTCHLCGAKISNWNEDMIPMEEHKKASPTCQVVTDFYINNQYGSFTSPRQLIGGIPEAAPPQCVPVSGAVQREEDMTIEVNRLKTFTDKSGWPTTCPVTPGELAKAGFYYTGENDKVICAFCKGRLLNWALGDSAFGEHMRHFPNCSYLVQLAREAEEREAHNYRSQESNHSSHDSFEQQGNGFTGTRPETRTNIMDEWKMSNSVKIVKDLGISDELISLALEELSLNGETELQTSPLLDIVFRLEDERQNGGAAPTPKPEETPTRRNLEQCDHPLPSPQEKPQNVIFEDDDSDDEDDTGEDYIPIQLHQGGQRYSPDPEVDHLKKENQRLKNSAFCRNCRVNAANVLFLPCRHIASCQECADNISSCPACGAEVLGTVKTYMS